MSQLKCKDESSLPVILLGAGGHASVLADILRRDDWSVLGVTNPTSPVLGHLLGFKYLGDDNILFSYSTAEIQLINGLGKLPQTTNRLEVSHRFRRHGFTFATVIDPSAVVGASVSLGEGVQVIAGVVIQPNCIVGKDCIINTGARIDHDCRLGQRVVISPGAILCGNVTIGDDVFVGAGSCIVQGVCIGENAQIGAGSVIWKDIPAGQRVRQTKDINVESVKMMPSK